MKKIILLFAILSTLFLTSCSIYNPKNEEPKSEENPITSNSGSLEVESGLSENLPEGSFAYSGSLEVSGVGPEISGEAVVLDDTLALRYTNLEKSYTDHLFINASLWEKFNNNNDLTLPGNIVEFDGIIYSLEGAAGNHYYQVAKINKLEKITNPTKERVQEIIDQFAYCEADNECSTFYGDCPFGCHQAVNTKYLDIAQSVMKNWYNNNAPKCVYGCVEIKGVKCENYKCKAVGDSI